MTLLKSMYKGGIANLAVEPSNVSKVKLNSPFDQKPNLWVLCFYGENDQLVRTWYYDSEKKRQKDLDQVLKQCPHLKVE
ncbi:hypothetical protein [Salmonirosea aquatica]|uniref:Uncharacterized protein n=1 Tax=Salmonirosea aquatica TaxID=2654236 RepID=A0A7C9BG65_9BACT|nr:hypothetical protein [Cytophagaceae bacterium SJW1-29]